MKTELLTPPFTPKSIKITFETQAELDAFGALCNSCAIIEAMSLMGGKLPSWKHMQDYGAQDINDNAHEFVSYVVSRLELAGLVKKPSKK